MAGLSLSPVQSKAAVLASAWLPATIVVVARLYDQVSTGLTVGVLLLCGLSTLVVLVFYGSGNKSTAQNASPGAGVDLRDRAEQSEAEATTIRAILDALDEPVLATDAAGNIVVVNRAAAEFFDRSQAQIAGLVIEDLFSQAEILGLHGAALAGATRHAQIRIPRSGGVRIFQVLAAPVVLGPARGAPTVSGDVPMQRPGVVLTLRDVTELATAVQLKTDFVANASHELRTPLASIRGAIDTLAEAADDPAMSRRLLQMIASNVARLEELTRDLLDLSRLESPEATVEKCPVRASEIAESLAGMFEQTLAERRLSLKFELDPGIENFETDPRLLTLILKNLIENSTKFAYEGTTIRVVGSAVTPPDGRVQKPGLRLGVVDQGIGIPLSHQARIFERFYQGDPSRSGQTGRRGTGLGLAIVKHAVKNLGGAVSVSSVWKEGTTITVELPDCILSQPPL